MKQVQLIFASLLLSVVMLSFKSYSQPTFSTAIEYNDYIIDLQNKIVAGIQDFVTEVSEGDKTSAMNSLNNMIAIIDNCLKELNTMGPWESNTAFRDAAVELFKFYKSVGQNEYVEFVDIKFKPELTDDDYAKLQAIVDRISEKEKIYDEKFATAQQNFADEFGFTIEGSKQSGGSKYTEPSVQKNMPEKSLSVVKMFLDYMIAGNQEMMKDLISPDFKKANKLDKATYRVNNYGLTGFVIFAYNDAKKQFTCHIWGSEKSWVHELVFTVAEVKGKWYIVPSSFDGEWVDPWTSVNAYVNE
ncbi:MAG TPA: hypothetical protein P5050_04560 [Bacteroidia bacterium]|nr:hypothetical protein [Bacteroidia bacterium]HRS58473.1 hypothetical protein [Bacteroidia bacterium]HRU68396.1 hypothetical protein [Bacteroidia bacterium]